MNDTNFSGPLNVPSALFLALLAAIMCSALHGMDSESLEVLGYSDDTRRAMAKTMAELSENALYTADWLQNHRLESLQAFL